MAALDKNQMFIYRDQPYRALEITPSKKLFQTKWEIKAKNLLTHNIEELGLFSDEELENKYSFSFPEVRIVECRIFLCREKEISYFDDGIKRHTIQKCDCSVDLGLKRQRIYNISFLGRFAIAAELLRDTDGPIISDLIEGQMLVYEDRPYQVISTQECLGNKNVYWKIRARNLLNQAIVELGGFRDCALTCYDITLPTEQMKTVNFMYYEDEACVFMNMDTYEMITVPFPDCRTDLEWEEYQSYTLIFLDRFLIDAKK